MSFEQNFEFCEIALPMATALEGREGGELNRLVNIEPAICNSHRLNQGDGVGGRERRGLGSIQQTPRTGEGPKVVSYSQVGS